MNRHNIKATVFIVLLILLVLLYYFLAKEQYDKKKYSKSDGEWSEVEPGNNKSKVYF